MLSPEFPRTNGAEDAIPASEVLRIVRLPKSDFSVLARKPFLAIAKIDPANQRIAIRRAWFRHWRNGTREQRAELIRTLAHEMTHFVRDDGEPLFRFQDEGHGGTRCPDARLASYAIGEIARGLWLAEAR